MMAAQHCLLMVLQRRGGGSYNLLIVLVYAVHVSASKSRVD